MIDEKLLISHSGRASFGLVAGECHARQNDACTFWQKQKQPGNCDGAQRPRATHFSNNSVVHFLIAQQVTLRI
jgi:hypothetical protein